jgi:transposase
MESESYKTARLQQHVAELERIIGQKQLEIDFLGKLLEIGSEELGFDIKKKFSTKPSSGTVTAGNSMPTK